MPNRTRIYIAFDADTDMSYYRTLKMWSANSYIGFDLNDAHELNTLRTGSLEETIKAKLRERMNRSKKFVLLLGNNTKNLYRFVRWEIEIAKKANIPIIVCNLNKRKTKDSNLCPAILNDTTAIHIQFKKDILKFALDNYTRKPSFDGNDYCYPRETYTTQGWEW